MALSDESTASDWNTIAKNHSANRAAFADALASCVLRDDCGNVRMSYTMDGFTLCWQAWGHLRGIPRSTMELMDRRLRAGGREWTSSLTAQTVAAERRIRGNLSCAAHGWWYHRLQFYEILPKLGVILHPRALNWSNVYADEFIPYVRSCGLAWKEPPMNGTADQLQADEGTSGSTATWYRGRAAALQQLADEKLPPGDKFNFKSRQKHSAYKECHTCQVKRAAVARAIALRLPPAIIMAEEREYARHLQWMYMQRNKLEIITQMATNERYSVENSDKCGDGSLHLPSNGHRVSSANTSLWQFRVSLQANVFAKKLFHLTLLFPNLRTGANFGITSYVTGLCRLIDLKLLTSANTKLMRGCEQHNPNPCALIPVCTHSPSRHLAVDGDSGNVCNVGLAFNCTLVKLTKVTLQQHRLPPDHSHTWHTDGLFSVIEGWLQHEGFRGCASVSELVLFLRRKFAASPSYHDQRVEINVLIANFAWTAWLSHHIEPGLERIGVPLVWKHHWCEATQDVVSHYKLALSDEASFAKDEWGPWKDEIIDGQKVQRTDPRGVKIMKSYPCVEDEPGWEPWIRASRDSVGAETAKKVDGWNREKVFHDLARYKYVNLTPVEAAAAKSEWADLHTWFTGHQTPEDLNMPGPIRLNDDVSISTEPYTTWADMWAKLLTLSPGGNNRGPPPPASDVGALANQSASAVGALADLRHPDRQRLATSTSAAVSNVVSHGGYTAGMRKAALAADVAVGQDYVQTTIDVQGALLLIELAQFENEFKVGLGVRTFNATMDDDKNVEISWYQPKSRHFKWPRATQFKWTVAGYDRHRKSIGPTTSLEARSHILPIKVETTLGSSRDEPRLKQSVVDTLREPEYAHLRREEPEAGEDEESSHSSDVDSSDVEGEEDDDSSEESDDEESSHSSDVDSSDVDGEEDAARRRRPPPKERQKKRPAQAAPKRSSQKRPIK